jgi:NAD(P)H-hydrate repair Nnr-like enzyme with NAD(P)H-hydrate dehydratase domain
MTGPDDTLALVEATLAAVPDQAVIVLDALALTCGIVNTAQFSRCASQTVITPNASEVEHLLGSAAPGDDSDSARVLADQLSVVALSGSAVAAPGRDCRRTSKGNSGLATSGSGDVLAGAVAGLAARGADPLRAALWAVTLHCSAGDRLSHRIGPLGFLARELLDELPGVLRDI